MNEATLSIYTLIIIDNGVLMEHRMFENPKIAEVFALEYFNASDEVKKRGGKPPHFLNFRQLMMWANHKTGPGVSIHIRNNKLKIRP